MQLAMATGWQKQKNHRFSHLNSPPSPNGRGDGGSGPRRCAVNSYLPERLDLFEEASEDLDDGVKDLAATRGYPINGKAQR